VGAGRALAAGPTAPALWRPTPHHLRPGLSGRDRVHGPHLHPWRLLPSRELGCGLPATCWRRRTEWANAGVFDALHLQVLDRLGERGQLDWSRAAVDTMSAGQAWGDHVGANPVDRGKPGTKLHLVCDGSGLPLAAVVTAANVNDTTMFQAILADIPPVRTPAGRRRTRPAAVHADKGDDSRANRADLRRRGITARIARREVEWSSRLGRHRWKVERALSWRSCPGSRADVVSGAGSDVGSRVSMITPGRPSVRRLEPIFEPVAGAVDGDDVAVV
jgi:transposase